MIAKKTMIVRSIASMSSLSNATDSCSEHDQHEPNGRKVHRPKLVCCTPGSPKRAYPWGVGLVSNHQNVRTARREMGQCLVGTLPMNPKAGILPQRRLGGIV